MTQLSYLIPYNADDIGCRKAPNTLYCFFDLLQTLNITICMGEDRMLFARQISPLLSYILSFQGL